MHFTYRHAIGTRREVLSSGAVRCQPGTVFALLHRVPLIYKYPQLHSVVDFFSVGNHGAACRTGSIK